MAQLPALSITSAVPDPALLDLPWNLPLDLWPEENIAILPKGISRHLVRFVHLDGFVIAIKETSAELARREYDLLRSLQRLAIPCVEPLAVVTDRPTASGEHLDSALVTRHLEFSLPYRALYSQALRPATATRLVDALAVLLARVHLAGFFWGDVSLSNTLFRRDAGAFAAYLVDAETGTLHESGLSDGQRDHDLEIGRINIAGELLDLQAGGRLDDEIDPVAVADGIVAAYRSLWTELTESESFPASERWRINRRVDRLNALGFDIEELSISQDSDGTHVHIQPKVVDAGHHSRRLLRLTGLDAGENQARRLLNDLDAHRASKHDAGDGSPGPSGSASDEEMLAHDWLANVFEPVIRAIPRDLRGKLEPAEVFHQLLEHRWYRSQNENRSVPLEEALASYLEGVLRHRRDELMMVDPPTGAFTAPINLRSAEPEIDEDTDADWRDKV
ncbi:MAG TPA: DUF4032 domain-containing protein [Pseudolysinimonas sp.]|nr:DUF4032 domain-containing protein [Pseudolysinimonas sp.]